MNDFNKSSQEVNKVYKTNDLGMFNEIKGNRPLNPQHVRRLRDSIKNYGVLQNPIIVNELMEVIDGHHRLIAAKEENSCIFYIIVNGYKLEEVQVLNLNQKNWTKKDFMEGYANMGVEPYVKLRNFLRRNKDFNITDCISMCSNSNSSSSSSITQKYRYKDRVINQKEVFEEGTWQGKDFNLAQDYADKIKMIKQYYKGYNRSVFVSTMIGLLRNKNFDFFEFIEKLKLQPLKLIDCSSVNQNRLIIEDVYNYRRREKVNLRY